MDFQKSLSQRIVISAGIFLLLLTFLTPPFLVEREMTHSERLDAIRNDEDFTRTKEHFEYHFIASSMPSGAKSRRVFKTAMLTQIIVIVFATLAVVWILDALPKSDSSSTDLRQ